MRPRNLRTPVLAALAAACWLTSNVWGAALAAGDVAGAPGSTVIAPLLFGSQGSSISGVQFDLAWDEGLRISVLAGEGARRAGKKVHSVSTGPRSVRIVVTGPNAAVIPDDELVRLVIAIEATAPSGPREVRLSNPVATSPKGEPGDLRSSGFRVEVRDTSRGFLEGSGLLNAASLEPGPISPGEIVTLLGPGKAIFPDAVAGEDWSVWVGGIAAPVLYVGASQINAVVPFGIDLNAPAPVEVQWQGRSVASVVSPVRTVTPGIFTPDSSGSGPAVALNEDGTPNSFENPAARGSVITVFATGLGQTSPGGADGQVAGEGASFVASVQARVGEKEAEVLYAGSAVGLIAGMGEVRLRVPEVNGLALPLVLRVDGAATQDGVTVAVR